MVAEAQAEVVPLTRATLLTAVAALTARDRGLARIVSTYGPPPLWARPGGFRTLVKFILEQQVSLASAASLFKRVDGELRGGWSPSAVVKAGEAGMRGHGLTRQKAAFVVALADGVGGDPLWFRRLARLNDADAHASLTALHGIGPWTASIYLIMVLRRPDVWPPGDLALHKAMGALPGRRRTPSTSEATAIAQRWAPHRATAARILWHGYLGQKAEG